MSTDYTIDDPFMLGGPDDGPVFEPCPSGAHPAVCVLIYDLGSHDGEYKSKPKPWQRQIVIGWEIADPETRRADGKPFVIIKKFNVATKGRSTFGTENSELRAMMESWRGKAYTKDEITAGINLAKMLGAKALLAVQHTVKEKNTYHAYDGISKPMKGMEIPSATLPLTMYTLADGEPPEIEWIPRWFGDTLWDIVRDSNEFAMKGKTKTAPAPVNDGDDIVDDDADDDGPSF